MEWKDFTLIEETTEILDDIVGRCSHPLTEEIEIEEMFWERLMEYTLHSPNCMGMAGIQIGLPYRGFYLNTIHFGEWRFRNPIIKQTPPDDEMILFENEGCMSMPGEFRDTLRHEWIDVYDDINGLQRYTGLLAVCVQHEFDHLEGTSFLDHIAPVNIKKTRRKKKKKVGRNDPCPECVAMGKVKPPKFKRCKLHFR